MDKFECPRCMGDGAVDNPEDDFSVIYCWLCEGQGEIDWIRYAMLPDWKSIDEQLEIEYQKFLDEL